MKAQEKLQKATEELEASLQGYARKFIDSQPLEETEVKGILGKSSEDSSLSGDDFGQFIEQGLSDQKASSAIVAGKVGRCMSKVYPIATFALGIVAFGADVGPFSVPDVRCAMLTNLVGWLLTFEDNRKVSIRLSHLLQRKRVDPMR